MLTHTDICTAVEQLANKYQLTKASYFGSYAQGNATEDSDLDLLVEFVQKSVTLYHLIDLQHDLENMLNLKVDVIHSPVPENSILQINDTVVAYANKR
jgi:predicted nucleotidyltransferase